MHSFIILDFVEFDHIRENQERINLERGFPDFQLKIVQDNAIFTEGLGVYIKFAFTPESLLSIVEPVLISLPKMGARVQYLVDAQNLWFRSFFVCDRNPS
jgi:hypothetical protein